jgi:glycopeptide antibiotics resistance protein
MNNLWKNQKVLGYAMLIYMCVVVVLIALVPFEFRLPPKFQIFWETNFSDFVINIILFIPIGFLYSLTNRKCGDLLGLRALTLGFLLSLTVELAQAFIPGRCTSIIDVFSNCLGVWLGRMMFAFLRSQLKEKPKGRLFSLELPLMGLVYLLIPLMWLNGMGTGEEDSRSWLLLLLGVFGTGVICSIYVYRFKHWGIIGYTKLSIFALCWFVFSSLPLLIYLPLKIAFFGTAVVFVVQFLARVAHEGNEQDKRFEIPTIKKLLPVYLIYLLLLATWPTITFTGDHIIFQEHGYKEHIVITFRLIEYFAAFTLLGYMVAEMRGRIKEPVKKTLTWTFVIAGGFAFFIEIIKTYPSLKSIEPLSIIVIISASIYGAMIYRLQLAAIQQSFDVLSNDSLPIVSVSPTIHDPQP